MRNSQKQWLSLYKCVVEESHDYLHAFLHSHLITGVNDEHEAISLGIVVVPDATNV